MRKFIALYTLVATVSSLAGCSKSKDEAPEPIPQKEFSADELSLDELRQASFEEVLERLDLNRDRVIGHGDVQAVRSCIEEGVQPEGYDAVDCDFDGDGELTRSDLVLYRSWVGWQEPRSELVRTSMSAGLVEFAKGEGPYGHSSELVELLGDYDGDGDTDADDAKLLADQLGDDPAQRLDRDGDGMLGLSDVWAFGRALARTTINTPSDEDVNGDGELDESDVDLVGALALLSSKTYHGFLDTNFDGRVDEADYCQVSDHEGGPNFYAPFLLDADATAAFETDAPALMLCRADGRSLRRFPAQVDSKLDYVLRPSSLYLTEVTELPEGYDATLLDRAGAGTLFIVTTEATERPVEQVRVGWAFDQAGGVPLRLSAGGEDPPAGAMLVTPFGVAPLEPGELDVRALMVAGNLGSPLAPAEKEALKAFDQSWNEFIVEFERKLTDCKDAGLPEEEASDALRFLYAYREALVQLQAHAKFRLNVLKAEHESIRNEHIATMNASAIQWNAMNEMIAELAQFEVGALVTEIALGAAKGGGLTGALAVATEKLASEWYKDATEEDQLPVYLTGEGSILTDLLDGIVRGDALKLLDGMLDVTDPAVKAWAGDDSVRDTLQRIVTRMFANEEGFPSAATIKDGMLEMVGVVRTTLSSIAGEDPELLDTNAKKALTGIVFALIKNVPKMLVNYTIRSTLTADVGAIGNSQAFGRSAQRLAAWSAADEDMTMRLETLETLLRNYESEFTEDADPELTSCAAGLASDVSGADAELGAVMSDAQDKMAVIAQERFGSETLFVGECFDGDTRSAFDQVMLNQAVMANYVDVAAQDPDASMLGALGQLVDAAKEFFIGSKEVAQTCSKLVDAYTIPQDAVDAYRAERQRIYEAQQTNAVDRKAAWDDFNTCLGGEEAFDFDFGELFQGSVWTNAARPLANRPTGFSCPMIAGLNPGSGTAGATFEIRGEGLDVGVGFTYAFVSATGTVPLTTVTAVTPPTVVRSTVPAGATPGTWDVVVTRTGRSRTMTARAPFAVDSPPGRIFVQSENGLWAIKPDPMDAAPLMLFPIDDANRYVPEISVSPDGTRIAVIREDTGAIEVWGLAGRITTITAGLHAYFHNPTFSADGTKFVAISGTYTNVIMVNSDGSGGVTEVSPRQENTNTPEAIGPVMSPNGQKIAFTSQDPGVVPVGATPYTAHAYTINVDGTGQTLISGSFEAPCCSGKNLRPVGWAGTGDEVIFWSDRQAAGVPWQLHRVDPLASMPIINYWDPQGRQVPDQFGGWAISPNGEQVAYLAAGCGSGTCGGDNAVWVMNRNGTQEIPLSDLPFDSWVTGLAWSPAGDQIVYLRDTDLRIVGSDGMSGDVILWTEPQGGALLVGAWAPIR